jgi:hypothetical protein
MKTKTRSRFLFLPNIGLVVMLLIGCTAPVTKPVEEVGDASSWDRFEAELESLRQQMKIPGLSATCFCQTKIGPVDHRKEGHLGHLECALTIENRAS